MTTANRAGQERAEGKACVAVVQSSNKWMKNWSSINAVINTLLSRHVRLLCSYAASPSPIAVFVGKRTVVVVFLSIHRSSDYVAATKLQTKIPSVGELTQTHAK